MLRVALSTGRLALHYHKGGLRVPPYVNAEYSPLEMRELRIVMPASPSLRFAP